MFSLENIEKYINEYDGNHSILMRLIESRIIEFAKDKRSGFHEDEWYMFYGFLLFEDDYFRIKKDIILNDLKEDILDVGCQFGFQSEIFKGSNKYIGLDVYKFYFNQDDKNVEYRTGLFPNKNIDISDKIVISNMSLGYFNQFLDKTYRYGDEAVSLSDTDLMLIDELSKAKILYCTSRPIFIEELKGRFNNFKWIGCSLDSVGNISVGVYKFWN